MDRGTVTLSGRGQARGDPLSCLQDFGLPESSLHLKKKIYLFILEGGEGREKDKDRSMDVRETWIGCLSHASTQGPALQPRHVP